MTLTFTIIKQRRFSSLNIIFVSWTMNWIVNEIPFQATQWHNPQYLTAVGSFKPSCALQGRREAGVSHRTSLLLSATEKCQRPASFKGRVGRVPERGSPSPILMDALFHFLESSPTEIGGVDYFLAISTMNSQFLPLPPQHTENLERSPGPVREEWWRELRIKNWEACPQKLTKTQVKKSCSGGHRGIWPGLGAWWWRRPGHSTSRTSEIPGGLEAAVGR